MASFLADAPPPKSELNRYRVLSPTAGIRVSPLCLGGMSIGDAWAEFMGTMDKAASFQLLDAFFEAGGNFIDTANNYQNEQSETWIGDWMAERGNRDQVVIATKFTSDYQSWRLGKGNAPNALGNHKRSMHMSVRDSLKKLRTEWIDILYIHWWDHTTSIRELMDSLHILVQQGKVLYLGASDMPAWIVSAANQYAVDHGKTPFSVYQGRWSLMVRDFERDIIPMAKTYGMALCPWDVLGGGKFQSKKALEERRKNDGLRGFGTTQRVVLQTEDEKRVSEALEKVAGELGIESVTAVALAYVIAKTENVFPLVGGRKVEHLKDNIEGLKIKLTEEQIQFLESVKPFDLGFPSNFLGEDPNITGHNIRLARTANMSFPYATHPKK
jgi:aryl-alcohol dehydrogenase-like predicted oxidoreductase